MPAAVEPPSAPRTLAGRKVKRPSESLSMVANRTMLRLRQEGMIYSALTPGNANTFGASGLEGTPAEVII